MPTPARRSRLLTATVAWVAVGALTALLAVQRVEVAAVDTGLDLESFFLPAAREVAAGRSPYGVEGYVYSPLVAVLLAPVASAGSAALLWKATLVSAAVAAVVLGTLAVRGSLSSVRTAGLAGVAALTLLWNWPMAQGLWFGQPDTLVLLALTGAMLAHSRGRRTVSGVALGLAALLKTWPAALLLWLLRSPLRFRAAEWTGVALAASVGLVMALVLGGPAGVRDMLAVAFRASDQDLAAYSVTGAGEFFFSDEEQSVPLVLSPVLQVGLTVVLGLVVIALLVLLLRRPGDARLALANLVFLVLLLLPVSHFTYLILPLPALWWWLARLLEAPGDRAVLLPVGVLVLWWATVSRVVPVLHPESDVGQRVEYGVVLLATLAAAAVSVLSATRHRTADVRTTALSAR